MLKKSIQFIFGVLIMSIAFNVFMMRVDTVHGMSGIGIMMNKTLKIDPSLTILTGNLILIIISFILLGFNNTKNTIIGSILFPLFIKLTEPLNNYINLGETEPLLIAIFGGILLGFGIGLVFKAGFTTGGVDILNQIVSKYVKIPIGKSMLITDGTIIFLGLITFGFQKFIYTLISLYIMSMITDKIMIGISKSKTFFIFTDKEAEIQKLIIKKFKLGATMLDAHGGYTNKPRKVILCVIETRNYVRLKEEILKIDEEADFLITDAYEVAGGLHKYKEEM